MVLGIETFREWFRGYEDHYAIIGGTACDLLMAEEGLDFRTVAARQPLFNRKLIMTQFRYSQKLQFASGFFRRIISSSSV